MLILARSQAAMTSGSWIEPPGWMIARMPYFFASAIESGFGKKPSDASTAPLDLLAAFRNAVWQESTREGCPIPNPSVAPFLAITIALDYECFTTFHANSRSARELPDNGLRVTVWALPRVDD